MLVVTITGCHDDRYDIDLHACFFFWSKQLKEMKIQIMFLTLKMEAAKSFETLVTYNTTS